MEGRRPRRPLRGQTAAKVCGRVPRGSPPSATRGHRGRCPSNSVRNVEAGEKCGLSLSCFPRIATGVGTRVWLLHAMAQRIQGRAGGLPPRVTNPAVCHFQQKFGHMEGGPQGRALNVKRLWKIRILKVPHTSRKRHRGIVSPHADGTMTDDPRLDGRDAGGRDEPGLLLDW